MAPLVVTRRTERGFERLYQRHVAQIYRYVLAILENEADAEDATQQTFLSAYRAWQRGERPRRPHNWLITIAHNVCRQRFRESARRPSEVVLDEEALPPTPDDEAPRAEEIRRALGLLAFNQRAALVMRELEGRPYREIGEVLGVSQSAVETLLFRARRALREQLQGDLTCGEAEQALSRQADGLLERSERASLRAHLRECGECASLERSQRARRAALRGIAGVPLPESLATFGGGTASCVGAGIGVGLAAKAAAVVTVGVLAAGVGERALDRASGHGEEAAAVSGDVAGDSGRAVASTRASGAGSSASGRSSAARSDAAGSVGGRTAAVEAAEPAPAAAPAFATEAAAAPAGESASAAANTTASAGAPDVVAAASSGVDPLPVQVPATPSAPTVPTPAVPQPPELPPAPTVPTPAVPQPPELPSTPTVPVPGIPEPPQAPSAPQLPEPSAPDLPEASVPLPQPPEVSVPAAPTAPSAPAVEAGVDGTADDLTETVETAAERLP